MTHASYDKSVGQAPGRANPLRDILTTVRTVTLLFVQVTPVKINLCQRTTLCYWKYLTYASVFTGGRIVTS